MKRLILLLAIVFAFEFSSAQFMQTKSSSSNDTGTFYSIRNRDFSQLIGASTSGLSLNYNADKAVLNGSFTLTSDEKKHPYKPFWLQMTPSLGTTSSLYEIGQKTPQPDFTLSFSFAWILRNKYYFDADFDNNYDAIKNNDPFVPITNRAGFYYTQKLVEKLNQAKPELKKGNRLYTAKRIEWGSIKPDFGATTYSFFDKSRGFADQFYKPHYSSWGVSANFNHYWYVNNEDVHWDGWPTTRFFFYTLSLRLGTNNNSESLKKSSINDVGSSQFDSSTNTTRQVIKTTSAYTGNYQEYISFTPSFELLYSFVSIFAVNAFGNYQFITNNSKLGNYGSIAGGLYFYTNENASKINIGIYYQHSLGVTPAKELIGIKTKVPINW